MVHIINKSPEYDPSRLPSSIDFHLATKDLFLNRKTKHELQVKLSKMDYNTIKKTIKQLDDMRYEALGKKNYKMAAYCKAAKEFADKYFYSVKKQKLV